MTDQHVLSPVDESPILPAVRTIGVDDLKDALRAGLQDFWAIPTHVVFLAILYPVIGLVLARFTMQEGLLPLVYPLVAGFALVGPFAAIGLYELSRRRERGGHVSWSNAFDVWHSPALGSIAALGLVQMLIFVAWLASAQAIYRALFDDTTFASLGDLLHHALTTPAGWALIIIGNGVGLCFAVIALTLSVVSFPLLLDRNIGARAAVMTSVHAVAVNPVSMAIWGLVVAVALLLGSLPFLIGLALVMPVLGHATWHLYRKVVEPARA